MTSSFKRSFIGYDPVSVSNELTFIDQEFAQKCDELRRELDILVKQRELLQNGVEKLRQELELKQSLRDDISSQLLTALIKGTGKIITAVKNMEEKELELSNKINERKQELLRLHNVTGKMSNEFLATATRYGTMLSWEKAGEANVKD